MDRLEKKMVTRQKILDAAYTLFDDKGYDETSYGDIAKKAGVGYGTIYTHFSSKENLLLEHYLELIYDQVKILGPLGQDSRNPLEHGRFLIDRIWQDNLTAPIRRLTVFFSYRWVSSKEDYDRVLDALNAVLGLVGDCFAAAQKDGLISANVDLDLALSLIRTAYLHALQDARFGEQERIAAKERFDQQVDYLLGV